MTVNAYVMIGIPGSGKSSYSLKLEKQIEGSHVVCPDEIRKSATGNMRDHSREEEVWQVAYNQAEALLRTGHSMIFDATNSNAGQRRELVAHIRSVLGTQGKIIGVWIQTPLATCKKRNANRVQPVEESVIEDKYDDLRTDPPSRADGFDEVSVITSVEQAL